MSETATKIRRLVVDEEAWNKVVLVKSYARKHPWHTDSSPAGDNPKHVCHLNDYRCVFTYTVSPKVAGVEYRHLSVSVPSEHFPNTVAVAMIAGLFGFTKAEQGLKARVASGDWFMHVEKNEPHCIVLLEELKDG